MDIPVNYLAVLVAAISNMMLGMLWFGPALFGTKWAKLGKIEVGKAAPTTGYVIAFIAALVIAYILSHFIYLTATGFGNPVTMQSALSTAFWVWLGFFATVGTGSVLWEMKPWGYYFITMGYWLVSLLVMAAILGAWQ